jgi:hypothetical protein
MGSGDLRRCRVIRLEKDRHQAPVPAARSKLDEVGAAECALAGIERALRSERNRAWPDLAPDNVIALLDGLALALDLKDLEVDAKRHLSDAGEK